MKKFLILLLSAFLLACSGSSYFARKGMKAQKAGKIGEASYFFIQSLRRNSNNAKAAYGLQTAGQEHLNKLLDVYFQFHNDEKLREAVYAFRDADNFYDDVSNVKVTLRFPEYYREYYEEDKAAFLESTYNQAQDHFRRQNFKDAEKLFSEIKRWDPNYKDAGQMRNKAEIIPLYDEALKDYDNGFYKTAYGKFSRIVELDGGYEQAASYQQESLRRGMFTVAFTPFQDLARNPSMTNIIGAKVLSDLSKVNNPFFQIVDRSNIERVLQEQKLALSNASDLVKVGEILGAKALLTAKVLEYGFQGGQIISQRRTGYEAFSDSVYNASLGRKELVTKYKKVYYSEFSGQSLLKCKVQFQLVSTENGRILAADLVDEQVRDEIRYITYPGNIRALVPGSWSNFNINEQGDRVLDTPAQRNELRKLYDARKNLKQENDLRSEAVNAVSSRISRGILDYEATLK